MQVAVVGVLVAMLALRLLVFLCLASVTKTMARARCWKRGSVFVCVCVVLGVRAHPAEMEPLRSCVSLYFGQRHTERQLLAHGAVLCFFMLYSAWRDECGGHKWLPLVTETLMFVGGCKNPHLSHGVPRVVV